jgi:hypothetical protein
MSKKILTSTDPSEITINFFSRIYNMLKLSIHNIITPPKPGNEETVVKPSVQYDIESPFSDSLIANTYTPNGTIPKRDSLELLKETYIDK